MICPQCKKEIKGEFSSYKKVQQEKNKIIIPMYGECIDCDIFYTWETIIDNEYSITETKLERFIFC